MFYFYLFGSDLRLLLLHLALLTAGTAYGLRGYCRHLHDHQSIVAALPHDQLVIPRLEPHRLDVVLFQYLTNRDEY